MDFEALLENFYNQLDLDGTTVIDVGAHVGRHAIPLARKVGIEGVVHAFEPIPLVRQQLTVNLTESDINNVIVYPFALSNVTRISKFNFVPNLPQESGLKARHLYNSMPEPALILTVPTYRLDDLICPENSVSFIKIDIEGGELDMLRGSKQLIQRTRPIVSFECGSASFLGYHETPGEIFDIFNERQYLIFSILGKKIKNIQEFVDASYAQNFWDYLAIPLEKEMVANYLL